MQVGAIDAVLVEHRRCTRHDVVQTEEMRKAPPGTVARIGAVLLDH